MLIADLQNLIDQVETEHDLIKALAVFLERRKRSIESGSSPSPQSPTVSFSEFENFLEDSKLTQLKALLTSLKYEEGDEDAGKIKPFNETDKLVSEKNLFVLRIFRQAELLSNVSKIDIRGEILQGKGITEEQFKKIKREEEKQKKNEKTVSDASSSSSPSPPLVDLLLENNEQESPPAGNPKTEKLIKAMQHELQFKGPTGLPAELNKVILQYSLSDNIHSALDEFSREKSSTDASVDTPYDLSKDEVILLLRLIERSNIDEAVLKNSLGCVKLNEYFYKNYWGMEWQQSEDLFDELTNIAVTSPRSIPILMKLLSPSPYNESGYMYSEFSRLLNSVPNETVDSFIEGFTSDLPEENKNALLGPVFQSALINGNPLLFEKTAKYITDPRYYLVALNSLETTFSSYSFRNDSQDQQKYFAAIKTLYSGILNILMNDLKNNRPIDYSIEMLHQILQEIGKLDESAQKNILMQSDVNMQILGSILCSKDKVTSRSIFNLLSKDISLSVFGEIITQVRSPEGDTLLMMELQMKHPHIETLNFILKGNTLTQEQKKSLLMQKNNDGDTPLMIVAKLYNERIFHDYFMYFLQMDNNLELRNQKNNKNETALLLAARHHPTGLYSASTLTSWLMDPNQWSGNNESIIKLSQVEADRSGDTPLSVAIQNEDESIVSSLLYYTHDAADLLSVLMHKNKEGVYLAELLFSNPKFKVNVDKFSPDFRAWILMECEVDKLLSLLLERNPRREDYRKLIDLWESLNDARPAVIMRQDLSGNNLLLKAVAIGDDELVKIFLNKLSIDQVKKLLLLGNKEGECVLSVILNKQDSSSYNPFFTLFYNKIMGTPSTLSDKEMIEFIIPVIFSVSDQGQLHQLHKIFDKPEWKGKDYQKIQEALVLQIMSVSGIVKPSRAERSVSYTYDVHLQSAGNKLPAGQAAIVSNYLSKSQFTLFGKPKTQDIALLSSDELDKRKNSLLKRGQP